MWQVYVLYEVVIDVLHLHELAAAVVALAQVPRRVRQLLDLLGIILGLECSQIVAFFGQNLTILLLDLGHEESLGPGVFVEIDVAEVARADMLFKVIHLPIQV